MDLRPSRDAAGTSAPAQTVGTVIGTVRDTVGDLDEPGFWQRHRSLRWLLPLAVVGAVTAGGVQLSESDAGQAALPAISPAALLAAIRTPGAEPYSGTLVSRLSSDLPQLPAMGGGDGVLSGSHTMRVWYGGPEQQRVAVLAASTETDVFRDGRDVWHWNSADTHAVHALLPLDAAATPVPATSDPLGYTPQALAAQAIASIDATTALVLGPRRLVADRSAYDLVITPDSRTTKIGSVRIAVDGEHKTPLGVQIFARGEDTPAIDVAFTGISYRRPGAANFRFAPPDGVAVRDLATAGGVVTGSGWSSVQGYRDAAVPLAGGGASSSFVSVSGAWGKGQLFECDLMSMLVTANGTVFVGTVDPAALYAAAAAK